VMDCSAERIGGVVRAVTSESLSVAGVAFINNSAPSGSVLYLDELDRSSISDTSFAGNIAGNGIAIQTGSPIDWDCRLGRWMPRQGALEGDFSAPECRLCPAGYYGAARGLIEPSCSGQCIRGHFCEEGTADPEPCPIGTHMPALGAASNESCIPCAPGQHQPFTGQSDCLTCPAGSFSPDVGLAACDPCPRGGYFAEAGAATRMVWEPCPAGSFNPTTGCKSSAACESCPIGTSSAMRGAESIETCAPCRPGTVAAEERSEICEPCAQGYYQNAVGATECIRCAAGKFCPKGSSLALGAQCDPGTYANLTDADGDPECFACPAGLSCAGGGAAPAVCSPGTAAKPARDKCAMCGVGTHQPYAGSASCIPCDPGFFCPEGSSAQLPASCPAGFYNGNASTTLESLDDCVGCALGSFCTGGAAQPTACAPGSIAPSANMSACELCPKGHYAASRTACEVCEAGTYAASESLSLCTPCPHPLSSSSGDVTCSTCKEGFYLLDGANGDPADIFKAPTKHCKPCPPDAICATNTTLETLGIPRNHWRASLLTTEIHECDASDHCSGSEVERSRRRLTATLSTGATADGSGCDTGHTGPLCEWCVSDEQYFDRAERGCADCPPTGRVGLKVVVAALAGAALLSYPALARTECGRYGAVLRLARSESQVGFQPKFKILVSFYQVAATLGPVYGVHLHKDFTRWTNFVDAISFDLLGLAYPNACIGSMRDRILIAALWPIAAIMLGGTALACYALTEWLLSDRTENLRRGLIRNAQSRLLYLAIIVAYLLLPSVSRAIFKAKQCESYDINVFSGEIRSYLVADLKVLCSAADVEYRGLDAYFWAFFVLWPVLVPLAFFSLLLWIRPEVVSQRVGDIAGACRFLWRDYEPGFLFWEVVDLLRKLFLASLVLFINIEHGSSKLLRLVVASVVSALFLAALALARPFKQSDDLFLACIANLLLTCCFMLGTVVKLCESAAYEDMCKTLVGFDSARGASAFVIALTAAMLIISLLVVVLKTASAVRMPTIRLASSGRPPVLELPPECHFHGFISHSWGTGQDQTHTVVRRLQLLLPGVRIWLDVDNLDDVGRLEESVADAMSFLVFLSAGYFRSFNCRRELYAALGSNRPFIPIFEADAAKGGASLAVLQAECRENCVEAAPDAYPSYGGPDEMIRRIFWETEPIVWVRVNAFQLESLKAVALRMLLHSPYYVSDPAELADGVMVPGETGPFAFGGPVTILVCRGNRGAFHLAEEVKKTAGKGRCSAATSAAVVVIREAEEALEGANAAPLSGHVVLLLYLNEKTFLDPGGAVARLVQVAMDRRIAVVLVHEQDPSCGGVPFRNYFQQTPQVLQQQPYKLYDTVAVPLYPAPEHRKVSLRLVLSGMGAVPCDAGPLRRRWQLLRRHMAIARLVRRRPAEPRQEPQQMAGHAR